MESSRKDPRRERNLDNVETKYIEKSIVKDLYEAESTPDKDLQRESLYTTPKAESVPKQTKRSNKQQIERRTEENNVFHASSITFLIRLDTGGRKPYTYGKNTVLGRIFAIFLYG